jgi:hypothetical protein
MVQAAFDFVRAHGKYPTPQEAWERLNQEPPAGFGIQRGNGRVSMKEKALTRGAFLSLWNEKRAQPKGADPA